MCRRLAMGRKDAMMLFLPAVALVIRETRGTVFDTPYEDLEKEDYIEYGQEVGIATAGFGITLSVVFGFVSFIAMLAMCCRCNRLHLADLAIAQAEGDNDGKGLDDMYEIEDYEDHISKHRKILWLFSFVIFLGYLFCAGYAYNGAQTTDDSFRSILDGTDVLLTKVQTALCAENGGSACADASVGSFILGIAAALGTRLDGVVDFIDNLSAVSTPLMDVSESLRVATGVINTTERAIIHINDSITNVNLVLTGDGNVAEFTDGGAVPTIEPNALGKVQEGRSALAVATNTTEKSRLDVAEKLSGNESEIVRIKYQLDRTNGNELGDDEDIRNDTLTSILDEVLQPMKDVTVEIHEVKEDMLGGARDYADKYLDMAVKGVAGVIFLPGAVLFLTSLLSGCFQSSKPLYISMGFVFMTQILFCLVAGIFLAIAKLNSDLCDNHLALMNANFGGINTTLQGVEVIVDFPKLEKVLVCDGQPWDEATPSNNFIDIFEAQEAFNISAELRTASSVITDNSGALSAPKDTLVLAQGKLVPLNNFVDGDFVDDVDIEESASEIDELLEDLPPTPFDWDNRTHQDALDDFFLKDVQEYSWNNQSTSDNSTYRLDLEKINGLIALMMNGVIGAGGFADIENPYNFQQARNLTNETVCSEDSPFFPSAPPNQLRSESEGEQIYTYDEHFQDLCSNVTVYYRTTGLLEELIEENDETRLELQEVRYEMGLIGTNVTVITDQQAAMGDLRDDMNATLGSLAVTLNELVDDLNDLAADLLSLNDVVMGASNFTKCGYIGDFYQDVYLDAMCTDLQGNIEAVAGPALVVVVLMFLSFCIQGCYGPAMRKRPRGTAGDFDGGKARLNASGDQQHNNLPTPHSPTPLVGNSGF